MFQRFALPWGMPIRFAGSLFLLVTLSTAGAEAEPFQTPFTLARFNTWVKKLCAQHTCQPIKVESLPLGDRDPGDAKALAVGRGDLRMGLLYNVSVWEGRVGFSTISFVPLRVGDRWTPKRMAFAAEAIVALSGGKLPTKTMLECVAILKRTRYELEPFPFPGQVVDGVEVPETFILSRKPDFNGIAGCQWLPRKKNVSFGFFSNRW